MTWSEQYESDLSLTMALALYGESYTSLAFFYFTDSLWSVSERLLAVIMWLPILLFWHSSFDLTN